MISEASPTRPVGSSGNASRAKPGSFDGWPPSQIPTTRDAPRATPKAIPPRSLTRPSDPQETTQRDARPDRRDKDRRPEEDRDQDREGDGAVVLGQSEGVAVVAQRVDDRDLA